MKKYFLIAILFSMVSCAKTLTNNPVGQSPSQGWEMPEMDIQNLESNFMDWWTYYNKEVSLSSDFTPMGFDSNIITKELFLEKLSSGDFIPIKLISRDDNTYYKLLKLSESADNEIRRAIKNVSSVHFKHFKMEGTLFPIFNFEDIDGNLYSNDLLKEKYIVLKCWFIHCKPCVAEFPELNELVDEYQGKTDVEFISLAIDTKDELQQFLKKKPFKYSVISDQLDFMSNELTVFEYPTHFLIDKNGVILKVTNSASVLIHNLEKIYMLKAKVK